MDRTHPPAAPGGTVPASPRRGVGLFAAGLLLALIAVMMFEQSARWMLTAMTRSRFVTGEFQIDNYRNDPGRGGFAYGGHIVSTGEVLANGAAYAVSSERLNELQAAGQIPGARVPVHYLPAQQPWTTIDRAIAFRVQAPEAFEINALGWVVFNVCFAAGAWWLIRRGVRLVKQTPPAVKP